MSFPAFRIRSIKKITGDLSIIAKKNPILADEIGSILQNATERVDNAESQDEVGKVCRDIRERVRSLVVGLGIDNIAMLPVTNFEEDAADWWVRENGQGMATKYK